MRRYLARRLLATIALLAVVATLVFFLIHLAPGDPALMIVGEEQRNPQRIEAVRKKLNLDQPLHVQYGIWVGGLLRGDLGKSFVHERPVAGDLALRLPRTLELVFLAVLIAVAVGVPLGILAARRRNSAIDLGTSILALVGISSPVFVVGTLLVLAFAVKLRWFASSGFAAISSDPVGHLSRLVLPAITLSVGMAAVITRMTRSAILEVISQDYIRTARAKGLPERVVLYKHALKNALIPVVTVVGVQMGNLLGGSVIVEDIFAWPGVSTYLMSGISQRDFPVVQGVVLLISTLFILINLGVDLLYGLLDPRIKYQ